MDLGIAGKTALLAGASAGLGKSSALALAAEGARLFISARGEERLLATAQEIRDTTGAAVVPITADHGTAAGREQLQVLCPQPDILVITCSPPPFTQNYRELTADQWRASFETSAIGSIELMRHYTQGMVERRFGRIVNISTMSAKFPLALRMLSGGTRAAVANYSAGLAKVVAKDNVIINSILPGMFRTPGMEAGFAEAAAKNGTTSQEEVESFVRRFKIPARTYGDPDDLGALCAMLCSCYVRFVVGQSLVVDGGAGGGLF
jgi:3-oxoacyl-[acyl-carrier protein] reductase